MRRILAWLAIVLTLSAFVLMCLILTLKINPLIPILMFVAAFILLYIVKRMPSDIKEEVKPVVDESAFFDSDDSGN